MFDRIIGSLLLAWFLSQFDFDQLFIKAVHELFHRNITIATYYFIFFIGGILLWMFEAILLSSYSFKIFVSLRTKIKAPLTVGENNRLFIFKEG